MVMIRCAYRAFCGLRDFGDEGHHFAVLRAADTNALLEAGVDLATVIARLMVCRVDVVLAIDVESARTPELLPLLKEFPILIEYLDAIVNAISSNFSRGDSVSLQRVLVDAGFSTSRRR
jgi:hypothetical protein